MFLFCCFAMGKLQFSCYLECFFIYHNHLERKMNYGLFWWRFWYLWTGMNALVEEKILPQLFCVLDENLLWFMFTIFILFACSFFMKGSWPIGDWLFWVIQGIFGWNCGSFKKIAKLYFQIESFNKFLNSYFKLLSSDFYLNS